MSKKPADYEKQIRGEKQSRDFENRIHELERQIRILAKFRRLGTLNPVDHPAGTVCLVSNFCGYDPKVIEQVTVVTWSKRGRVRLLCQDGGTERYHWENADRLSIVTEILDK